MGYHWITLSAKSNAVANGQVVKATLAKTKLTMEVIEGLRILLAELPPAILHQGGKFSCTEN